MVDLSIAMLVYQRVNLPLNPIKPPFSYGFPMVFQWLNVESQDIMTSHSSSAKVCGAWHKFPGVFKRPPIWNYLEKNKGSIAKNIYIYILYIYILYNTSSCVT